MTCRHTERIEVEVTSTIPARPKQFKQRCIACGDEGVPYTRSQQNAQRKAQRQVPAAAAQPLLPAERMWWAR